MGDGLRLETEGASPGLAGSTPAPSAVNHTDGVRDVKVLHATL